MSEYKKLLECWHKLEHFNPTHPPKENDVLFLNKQSILPWDNQEINFSGKKTKIYTIYLKVCDLSEVDKFIHDFFDKKDSNENKNEGKFCYASLKIDASGKYINNTIGISTLPWALGQLETKKISSNNWSQPFLDFEEKIKEDLQSILFDLNTSSNENYEEENEEGSIQKRTLSYADLQEAEKIICDNISWTKKPDSLIMVKIEEKLLSKTEKKQLKVESKNDLLNSFFTSDIEKVISNFDKVKKESPLKKYLSGNLNKYGSRDDLNTNPSIIKNTLNPLNFPDSCWPSQYSLNLMQQFAVNTIIKTARNGEKEHNLFSVNGPPGTGKTTLLRDAVAGIITERAKELIKFKNPLDAFDDAGEIATNNPNFSHSIVTPKDNLNIAGILIASSNNGAVENITNELPLKTAITPFENEISYFKNAINQDENWGLLSATLGNKKNKETFTKTYWQYWKDKKPVKQGLQIYLKKQSLVGTSKWKDVTKRFEHQLNLVQDEKNRLEKIRLLSLKKEEINNNFKSLKNQLEKFKLEFAQIVSNQKTNTEEHQILINKEKHIWDSIKIIQSTKPSFFEYWFSKKARNSYLRRLEDTFTEQREIKKSIYLCDEKSNSLSKSIEALNKKKEKSNIELTKIVELQRLISDDKNELGENYCDDSFWKSIESKEAQNSNPWYSNTLKKLQTELFKLSLELHEVFILTANGKKQIISKTLSCFFQYLSGGIKVSPKEAVHLWNTFFLIVPVVSSTFASIGKMFDKVNAEKLPWLFIDEAGQAISQAALGAIWRSKNVVAVGDPFQLEPVNTISDLIIKNIREHYSLKANQVNSSLSVQIAADRVNKKGMEVSDSDGHNVWIGSPLRVHRRCINPMFRIANAIAYDNNMYLSTNKPESLPLKIESSFINVSGIVNNRHYNPSQGEVIKNLLIEEINTINGLPDIFIITPYREVTLELKKYLKEQIPFQYDGMGGDESKSEFARWINTRVGTVHTFQGKQAAGVFLCLGLDNRTKASASWASQKPNLLNVALTRAQYKFVAVGDESIWLDQPYFNQLKYLNESIN